MSKESQERREMILRSQKISTGSKLCIVCTDLSEQIRKMVPEGVLGKFEAVDTGDHTQIIIRSTVKNSGVFSMSYLVEEHLEDVQRYFDEERAKGWTL